MRIVDLLRHTAGFTYSFQERSNIDAAHRKTDVESWNRNTSQSFIDILSEIPLEFDPGTEWNYSVATDVLGALVERGNVSARSERSIALTDPDGSRVLARDLLVNAHYLAGDGPLFLLPLVLIGFLAARLPM